MNIFSIVGLFIAISCIGIGVVTLFGGKRIHFIWATFAFSVALWGFGIYKIATTLDSIKALFWWRVAEVGVILIPVLLTHFVLEFLEWRKKLFLFVFYAISFILIYLDLFTNYFIHQLRLVFNQFYYISPPTPLYTFFVFVIFIGAVIFNIAVLTRAYRRSRNNIIKSQIEHLILAFLLGFVGGVTSYLPVYQIDILPVFNITIFFAALIVAYTISRYQFMNIKVILTESLVLLIGTLLLSEVFIAKSLAETLYKTGILAIYSLFGYLLIRSVIREIQRRAELQRLYREVEKLSKAKSEFISIASHQLRTPLTAIKGYISMLMEGTYGKFPDKQKKPMENVYQSNERLIKLVNDLLNLSRMEAGRLEFKPQSASLEEIVVEAVKELKINAEKKGLYIKMAKLPNPLPQIMADCDKLRQVILNIIDNAIKYTKKGGLTIGLSQTDGWEQIKIVDTGEGLDKKEIENLFQMFSRAAAGTKLHVEGAGIGLHVAKKFIEMHNGKIWVESQGRGKGSTFYIELPKNIE